MLKYFKYVAVISFLLVLIVAFFAGLYFRSFAANSVIQNPISHENSIMVDKFSQNIFCKYEPVLKTLHNKSIGDWQENKYTKKLLKITTNLLGTHPATKISIYTNKQEQLFTTNPAEIVLLDQIESNILPIAQSQGQTSRIIKSMGIYDEHGTLKKGSYVHSVFMFDTSKCTKPATEPTQLYFEIYNDITAPWQKLYYFQAIVSAGIIITFLLLYVALFITSRKTEKLINKQHEEKLTLEKAKAAAETQNQQKSMFLANVSHELRTPLNAIIGFSEIIKDEVMGPVGHPQYKEYVTDINGSGVHLLSLINDILDYSKAEARKLDVEAVDIDLSKISQSCIRLVQPRANEAKVELIEKIPAKHLVFSADPKRMKQVILNLLSNAIKFTQEGGNVTLTLKEDILSGTVSLIVSDNGIGIAPKDISKAMSPFGQIDSSISRRYEGTGLGLPLTKKLTELMGGTFDIKSEVGLGTTIALTFPIVKTESNISIDKF